MLARRHSLLLAAVLVLAAGCAAHTARHDATVASGVVYQALGALQDVEATLHQTGQISDTDHRAFARQLVTALEAGQRFNTLVRDWPPGAPAPAALRATTDDLTRLTESTFRLLPLGPARDAIAAKVIDVERVIISVLVHR